jgi:hypothetical protein
MSTKRFDRRLFLRGAGGIALALPFLDMFRSSTAASAPLAAPKRFVVMFSANGTIREEWTPDGTEQNFTLRKILSPLEAHKQKLLVLSGVDAVSAQHDGGNGHARGMAHLLTGIDMVPDPGLDTGFGAVGYAGGISVDQAIAAKIGGETKLPSLELGVQSAKTYGAHPYSRMVYAAKQQPLPAEDDPKKAFERIFADLGVDPQKLAVVSAQRKSVLDFVLEDFKSLEGRVGGSDKIRLDAHATAVRSIEKQIEALGAPVGAGCVVPDLGDAPDPAKQANYPAVGKLQMDILAMALACDLTRVATLMWSSGQSGVSHPWVEAGGHHGLSHEGESNAEAINQLVSINRWYATQLAYLAEKLDGLPEGDGSVLDNSVILWTSEVAVGNTHSYSGIPMVLVGSAGGALRTGRHVVLQKRSHNDLFVTLMNSVGASTSTFGDPEFNEGQIETLLA